MEAVGLPEIQAEFIADTSLPFSYVLLIFQDTVGNPPEASAGADYWATIGEPDFPVVADIEEGSISDTPYEADRLPGKCVLSPELELLHCYSGDDDTEGFAAITEHAAAR